MTFVWLEENDREKRKEKKNDEGNAVKVEVRGSQMTDLPQFIPNPGNLEESK